ncbi:MAG: hypothetical protein M1831_006838 [Alyxoria varia]|nr:MAG: hypothetical protein M1831_006838 [Alyxoria varia]
MDPATAFQVACGVLQLIEFGVDTAKLFQQIYTSKSSLTAETQRIDYETQLLKTTSASVTFRLKSVSKTQLNPKQAHLCQIAEECDDLAQRLLSTLDSLKQTGPQRRRDVPAQWWKFRREKGKIEDIRVQLERRQELLNTQMLAKLCGDVDVTNELQSKKLDEIDINQVKSLKVFQQMNSDFQNIIGNLAERMLDKIEVQEKALASRGLTQINPKLTKYAQETRGLIKTLDLQNKAEEDFHALMQSLNFPTMTTRQEEIHDAYPETFEWLMKRDAEHYTPGSDFMKWLETDTRLY